MALSFFRHGPHQNPLARRAKDTSSGGNISAFVMEGCRIRLGAESLPGWHPRAGVPHDESNPSCAIGQGKDSVGVPREHVSFMEDLLGDG